MLEKDELAEAAFCQNKTKYWFPLRPKKPGPTLLMLPYSVIAYTGNRHNSLRSSETVAFTPTSTTPNGAGAQAIKIKYPVDRGILILTI